MVPQLNPQIAVSTVHAHEEVLNLFPHGKIPWKFPQHLHFQALFDTVDLQGCIFQIG